MDTKFLIRECKESDFPFIYATLLRGFRFANEMMQWWDQEDYFKTYHDGLEIILHRPDTAILMACLPDDPETILGYAILGQGGTVHYVHVKEAFRRFGIARALCPDPIKRATFMTPAGWSILRKKYPEAKFIPMKGRE